ncbi:hypothetical protein OJAV_G00094450 [Oryzias javanicus]|uniref:Chemokine interleukin-8-like domain-containing protein n=1 Tax=Oryzias javanicus TaxID=123683 RepID=A0A3S2MK40_ORYJA|nr:hypothetical protein OJAV_G00094450 [Oryzias javanicus]
MLAWVERFRSKLPFLQLYKGWLVFFTFTSSLKPLRSPKMKSAVLLLILCCFYITSLHAAFSRGGCICLKVTSAPVPARMVKKVEVIPPTGRCRKTEIIITRRTGSRLCADPKAKWLQDLLSTFRQGMEGSSTARPTITPTTTTNHQG